MFSKVPCALEATSPISQQTFPCARCPGVNPIVATRLPELLKPPGFLRGLRSKVTAMRVTRRTFPPLFLFILLFSLLLFVSSALLISVPLPVAMTHDPQSKRCRQEGQCGLVLPHPPPAARLLEGRGKTQHILWEMSL